MKQLPATPCHGWKGVLLTPSVGSFASLIKEKHTEGGHDGEALEGVWRGKGGTEYQWLKLYEIREECNE